MSRRLRQLQGLPIFAPIHCSTYQKPTVSMTFQCHVIHKKLITSSKCWFSGSFTSFFSAKFEDRSTFLFYFSSLKVVFQSKPANKLMSVSSGAPSIFYERSSSHIKKLQHSCFYFVLIVQVGTQLKLDKQCKQ